MWILRPNLIAQLATYCDKRSDSFFNPWAQVILKGSKDPPWADYWIQMEFISVVKINRFQHAIYRALSKLIRPNYRVELPLKNAINGYHLTPYANFHLGDSVVIADANLLIGNQSGEVGGPL